MRINTNLIIGIYNLGATWPSMEPKLKKLMSKGSVKCIVEPKLKRRITTLTNENNLTAEHASVVVNLVIVVRRTAYTIYCWFFGFHFLKWGPQRIEKTSSDTDTKNAYIYLT